MHSTRPNTSAVPPTPMSAPRGPRAMPRARPGPGSGSRLGLLLLAGGWFAAGAACTAADAGPGGSSVGGWHFDAEPLLVIPVGAVDEVGDPVGPGYATWATRLPDGAIVISDHHGPGIHRFDAQGRLERSVVRPGNGPGEMRGARWISTCGTDTLLYFDYSRRMFLHFTPELDYLGEYRPEEEPDALRCRGDKGLLVIGLPAVFPPMGDSGERSSSEAWVADFEGRRQGRIGTFPAWEGRALGRRTISTANGQFLVVGDGEGPRAEIWEEGALDGPVGRVTVGAAPRAPTAEDYEAAIRLRSDFIASERGREVQYERLSAIRPPASVPPYLHFDLLEDGTLWAQVSAEGAPRARFTAQTLEGELLADIELPHPFVPFEAGPGWFLGSRPADGGTQEVVLFRVVRPDEG
jgi:hypothetical protein